MLLNTHGSLICMGILVILSLLVHSLADQGFDRWLGVNS